MGIEMSVTQRKIRDGQDDFVTTASSAIAGYTSTKQSHANHGGPKIARSARDHQRLAARMNSNQLRNGDEVERAEDQNRADQEEAHRPRMIHFDGRAPFQYPDGPAARGADCRPHRDPTRAACR